MTRPLFTVAVSFYDVAPYLGALLRSLAEQTYGVDRLEVVLVDDGSTDGSAQIAARWAARRPGARLVRQENAGPGAARNRALEVATGEWFTSVDADDVLDRDYFAAVARLLERDIEGRADLVAPRLYLLDDATGRFRDQHPLGHKHRFGDRLARLADEPEAFTLGTPFLRTALLREHDLRYDVRVVPTYEDAHLIGRYLAHVDDPVVAIAASARYFYRKRAAGDSLVQSSWERPERFDVVPERGYLDLLDHVARVTGRVPAWAQYMVLYDLLWYLKEEQSMSSRVGWVDGDLARRFLATVAAIMDHVDAAVLEQFCCNPHPWTMRQALLVRFADDGVTPRVHRWSDDAAGRAQASVLCRGRTPALRAFRDGVEVPVEVTGTRLHAYFGEEFMTEVSVRWPGGPEVALWVDGVPAVLRRMTRPRPGRPPAATYRLAGANPAPRRRGPARSLASAARVVRVAHRATGRPRSRVVLQLARQLAARRRTRRERERRAVWAESIRDRARHPEVRARYAGAWILLDRPHRADDNGEHLYRYLARNRPDVNAFFLLERDSEHWDRLAAEGFRLVPYGSDDAALLTLHAVARLSSDAVAGCMYPVPRRDLGEPPGIFVFLQHGILKDDASRWLNGKQIDLMITSTEGEYQSFVGPRSPYALQTAQVARTGLARYDRLHELRQQGGGDPRGVLVLPTWRRTLRDALERCTCDDERVRVFRASAFGTAWLELLSAPETVAAAERTGAPVRLLLHPLLDRALPELALPDHVQRVDLARTGFQDELVRSCLLVTDYTSVAFDAAYVDIPVVYYQFDADTMFDGSHPLRRGYFDYATDAFGPVVADAAAARQALADVAARGFTVGEPYRERAARAFGHRDARSCERIVAAVERRLAEVSGQ